jgi:alpha-tubulin suppressor-like RCC1 family protein
VVNADVAKDGLARVEEERSIMSAQRVLVSGPLLTLAADRRAAAGRAGRGWHGGVTVPPHTSARRGWYSVALLTVAALMLSMALAPLALASPVLSFGENKHGQLGDGTTEPSNVPVPVCLVATFPCPTGQELSGVASLGAAYEDSYAVLNTGNVLAWGANAFGELGDGTTSGPETCEATACSMKPVPVCAVGATFPCPENKLSNVTAVAAGSEYTLALLSTGEVVAWGRNPSGQLGNGTTTTSSLPVYVCGAAGCTSHLREVIAIAAGGGSNLALLRNGEVMAWGNDAKGQLGVGTEKEGKVVLEGSPLCEAGTSKWACSRIPVRVPIEHATAIATNTEASEALLENHTVRTWGANEKYPALGDGRTPTQQPFSIQPVAVCLEETQTTCPSGHELSEVTAISTRAGGATTLALLSNHHVKAWGFNHWGQIGNGNEAESDVAVPVCLEETLSVCPSGRELSGVAAVNAGAYHSFALLERAHTLMAWGDNEQGQLGNGLGGLNVYSDVPVEAMNQVTAATGSGHHSLALVNP